MSSEYFSLQLTSVDDFTGTDFLHIYGTFQSSIMFIIINCNDLVEGELIF